MTFRRMIALMTIIAFCGANYGCIYRAGQLRAPELSRGRLADVSGGETNIVFNISSVRGGKKTPVSLKRSNNLYALVLRAFQESGFKAGMSAGRAEGDLQALVTVSRDETPGMGRMLLSAFTLGVVPIRGTIRYTVLAEIKGRSGEMLFSGAQQGQIVYWGTVLDVVLIFATLWVYPFFMDKKQRTMEQELVYDLTCAVLHDALDSGSSIKSGLSGGHHSGGADR